MSGYIIEEPEECPIYYTSKGEISNEYWLYYSPIQKKRFAKVLRQMKEVWYEVYNFLKFMREYITIHESNNFMGKVHKMFFIKHNDKINYYNDEQLRLRKNKHYLSKKINKLKNSKNKI